MVQHYRGGDGDVEGGRASPIVGDVHEPVAHGRLLLGQAVALVCVRARRGGDVSERPCARVPSRSRSRALRQPTRPPAPANPPLCTAPLEAVGSGAHTSFPMTKAVTGAKGCSCTRRAPSPISMPRMVAPWSRKYCTAGCSLGKPRKERCLAVPNAGRDAVSWGRARRRPRQPSARTPGHAVLFPARQHHLVHAECRGASHDVANVLGLGHRVDEQVAPPLRHRRRVRAAVRARRFVGHFARPHEAARVAHCDR